MKIYTSLSAIRAISALAAHDDIRYYLNGLLIEASAHTTRIVGTNGHVMGIYNNIDQENELDGRVSFILPDFALALLKPAKNKLDQLVIETDGARGTLTVVGGASVNFTAIDGKYPDYSRVMPDKVTGEAAQFNPDYVADFKKAYKLLNAKTFHIHHNGHGGAVVDFGLTNFLGVMMPLRSSVSLESYNPAAFKTAI
jgi:DNA polymerase-3 subunit beta